MFAINEDKSIEATRGDVVYFGVTAKDDNGLPYKFQPNDVVRMSICVKKDCSKVVMSKSFEVEAETERVEILLTQSDTTFGEIISKPVDYWYEIVLNPDTNPQTIIGYDVEGTRIFKLYPECDDASPVEEKDIPIVDSELSLTSNRPIQNQAVARQFLTVKQQIDILNAQITASGIIPVTEEAWQELNAKGTWLRDRIYVIVGEADVYTVATNALNTANYAQSVAVNAKNTADIANATANTADDKANALQVALSNLKEAKIQKGTYAGTGEKTFTLNFDISPSIVMLFNASYLTMFIRGYGSISYKINLQDMNSSSIIVENWNGGSTVVTQWGHRITWGENSLTIENYSTDYTMFNSSGATNNYIAIGGGEE